MALVSGVIAQQPAADANQCTAAATVQEQISTRGAVACVIDLFALSLAAFSYFNILYVLCAHDVGRIHMRRAACLPVLMAALWCVVLFLANGSVSTLSISKMFTCVCHRVLHEPHH